MFSKIARPLYSFTKNQLLFNHTRRGFAYRKPSTPSNPRPETTKLRQKNIWLMNLGALATIFGMCYLLVPLYRIFCQQMGLQGDTHQKNYSDLSKAVKQNKSRKFTVVFEGEADPEMNWDFEPEQSELNVHAGETALTFYRATNNQSQPVIGVSTYVVYPEYASAYFSKIQCFCFNQQMLNAGEEILMPLYFYLEPEIEEDLNLENIKVIRIAYRFFRCKNQELAQLVHQQNVRDIENKLTVLDKRQAKLQDADEKNKVLKQIKNLKLELKNLG